VSFHFGLWDCYEFISGSCDIAKIFNLPQNENSCKGLLDKKNFRNICSVLIYYYQHTWRYVLYSINFSVPLCNNPIWGSALSTTCHNNKILHTLIMCTLFPYTFPIKSPKNSTNLMTFCNVDT